MAKIGIKLSSDLPQGSISDDALTRVKVYVPYGGPSVEWKARGTWRSAALDFEVNDYLLNSQLDLRVQVKFPNKYGATASAKVWRPSAIEMEMISSTHFRGQVFHEDFKGKKTLSAASNPQCTVRCPGSGDSRSGIGVCITCRTKSGVIELCC